LACLLKGFCGELRETSRIKTLLLPAQVYKCKTLSTENAFTGRLAEVDIKKAE